MSEALAHVIRRCFEAIDKDPQVLLEQDGGPEGLTADVVVARFYGYDDQLDAEIRLPKALQRYRVPKPIKPSLSEPSDPTRLHMPTTEYELQSAFATGELLSIDAPDETFNPATHMVSVLCLRYRRRRET